MRSPFKDKARLQLGISFLALSSAFGACVRQSEETTRDGEPRKSRLEPGSLDSQLGTVVNIDDAADSGSKSEDDDVDPNDVLDECGVDDVSDRSRPTFSTQMSYTYDRIINAGVAQAKVPLTSILNLKGTLDETTLDVTVNVGALAGTINGAPVPESELGPIAARAEELAKEFRGPVTGFSLKTLTVPHKEWKRIVCSVPSSNKLRNTRNGHETEVEFYPAYPPNVSPIADRVRYEKELGDYRFFRVKATVTKTDNPILTKKEYEGTVVIEKISNVRETPIGEFRGDTAYRVTNRFGSEDETLALGFHLWTEYYIDHGQRTFSNIIADVGDDFLMLFKGQYKGEGKTQKATYATDIKPIIDNTCTSCHNGSGGRVDLRSFTKAKENGSDVVARVYGGSMPPSGALNSAQKALFKAWKDSGYPEN